MGRSLGNNMRCTECGYDGMENVAGRNCIKCGAKLHDVEQATNFHGEVGVQVDDQLKKTVVQTGSYTDSSQSLKKTVVQGALDKSLDNMQATISQDGPHQWNGAATVVEDVRNDFEVGTDDDERNNYHEHYVPILVGGKLECPKCHYPLSSDSLTNCPNCMADFTGADEEDQGSEEDSQNGDKSVGGTIDVKSGNSSIEKEDLMIECDNCKEKISALYKYCPYCATEVVKKTVAFRKKRKKNSTTQSSIESHPEEQTKPQNLHCHLSLLPDDEEDVKAITNNYEGNNVILNRANTEPDNQSITSKEQAELIYENGQWYIENRSHYGTTFLAVNRRLPLIPGDIVMLGDRRFIFGIDDSK